MQIEPQVGDMLNLPYKSEIFDDLIGFHSIYHTDYNGMKQVVEEIHRVLKKNAESFLTFNSKANSSFTDPSNKIIDSNTIIKTQGIEKGIAHTFLDYEEIITLLGKFKMIRVQHIQDFFDNLTSWHYFVRCSKKWRRYHEGSTAGSRLSGDVLQAWIEGSSSEADSKKETKFGGFSFCFLIRSFSDFRKEKLSPKDSILSIKLKV